MPPRANTCCGASRSGPLLPSAHAVDREFRVMRALAGTPVPVPRVHALCEDDAVIGSAFYVMEFLDGRIFWDQRLPEIASPAERGAMFNSMNAVIAALHNVDYDGGRARRFRPSRQLHGPPDRALEPAVPRLRDRDDRGDGPADRLAAAAHPAGERAGDRPRRLPHGQSGVSQDRARVIGVLDWELSTIGDPLADFAYHVMTWRVTPELFRGLAGIDFAASGIPDEAAYVAAYCRRTGRDEIAAWDFYMVYSLFRIAAILQGIAKRALDGTAASAEAAEVGRIARPLAEQAWDLAQTLR